MKLSFHVLGFFLSPIGQYLRFMMLKQIKYFLHSFFVDISDLGFGNVNPLICPDLDLKIIFLWIWTVRR